MLADGVEISAAQDQVRAIDLRVAEEHSEARHDRERNPQLTPSSAGTRRPSSAAASGCGCSLAPALQAVTSNLERVLRAGSPGTVGRSRLSGRSLFVVFEVALSLLLLAGTGLLGHSLLLQYRQPAGLDTERLVRLPLQLPESTIGASEEEQAQRVQTPTHGRQSLPGG